MCIKLPKVIQCINQGAGEEVNGSYVTVRVFWWGGGDLWLILLNMGYYTIQRNHAFWKQKTKKGITTRQFEPLKHFNDLK